MRKYLALAGIRNIANTYFVHTAQSVKYCPGNGRLWFESHSGRGIFIRCHVQTGSGF
jgi:hypothetical protein